MSLLPGTKAPNFAAMAYRKGGFEDVSLSDYAGSWLLIFFYPTDYGHIASSELLELDAIARPLASRGCRVLGVSRDSVVVHAEYAQLQPAQGGVEGISFPLLGDVAGHIARVYGMEVGGGGYSLRGYYILCPEGVVRARVVADLPVALHAQHILKQVEDLVGARRLGVESRLVLEEEVEASSLPYSILHSEATYYQTHVLHKEKYPIYEQGKRQSPINIEVGAAVEDSTLSPVTFKYSPPWELHPQLNYTPQPTTVQNMGHGFEIDVPASMQARIYRGPLGDTEYRLCKVGCHWGTSEHSVDGTFASGELHLLHYNLKYSSMKEALEHEDGMAVVAILLTQTDTAHNHQLEQVADVLPLMKLRGQKMETPTPISFKGLLPSSPSYYTYKGSLTTPDFREVVEWIVMEEHIPVSSRCIAAMKSLRYGGASDRSVSRNTRPVAPTGDRVVRTFHPHLVQGKVETPIHHVH